MAPKAKPCPLLTSSTRSPSDLQIRCRASLGPTPLLRQSPTRHSWRRRVQPRVKAERVLRDQLIFPLRAVGAEDDVPTRLRDHTRKQHEVVLVEQRGPPELLAPAGRPVVQPNDV